MIVAALLSYRQYCGRNTCRLCNGLWQVWAWVEVLDPLSQCRSSVGYPAAIMAFGLATLLASLAAGASLCPTWQWKRVQIDYVWYPTTHRSFDICSLVTALNLIIHSVETTVAIIHGRRARCCCGWSPWILWRASNLVQVLLRDTECAPHPIL